MVNNKEIKKSHLALKVLKFPNAVKASKKTVSEQCRVAILKVELNL